MKNILIALLLSLTSFIYSQSQFQQFINHVNSLTDPVQKVAAIDSFMIYARTVGIPFIEDSTANFIYLGNLSTVAIAGDFNDWNSNAWPLTKLTQTSFWYRFHNFEMDARLDYKFVLNGSNWILDPENIHTCSGGFGPNSELSMPLYIQPWEIQYQANIAHGTIITKNLYSTNVGTNYQLNIYLPPGYDSLSAAVYPTVYFQDGSEYISLGKAVNVIDNLIDSMKIEPVIAVFVTPNNRNEEYAGTKRNQYRLFFVNELVPYIDANYRTNIDAKERLVLGDSFGGNISALISYNHPEVFGLCGLHSAAFWPNNYEAYNLILSGPIKDIKWSSIWGTYESLYPNMRTFRDYLNSSNYELDWLERPEGHSWGLWRASIDRMLMYFFPASANGIGVSESYFVNEFLLYQNFPNPFNPTTSISWNQPTDDFVIIKIYDILGNEVATLVNENIDAGNHTINFDASNFSSGMYIYKLQSVNSVQNRKMMLLK